VLRELAERLDAPALVRAAEADGEQAYAQRLGYLLERIGRAQLAAPLAEWLQAKVSPKNKVDCQDPARDHATSRRR
jgi:hypothetical protein